MYKSLSLFLYLSLSLYIYIYIWTFVYISTYFPWISEGGIFLGDSFRFGAASQLPGRGGVEAEKLGGSDTLPETSSKSH